jgi:hypothetical protein
MSEAVHSISRGKTYYGETQTIDVSSSYANVGGKHLEGHVKQFRNVKGPNDTTDPREIGMPRSNNPDDRVTCMLVRNKSGVTLHPGQCVTFATDDYCRAVNGYARTTAAQIAGFVDDQYTSAGVRDGDLFWMVIRGQCLAKTPNTDSEFGGTLAAGDVLYGLTSAAANATTTNVTNTAGRFQRWNGTASSTSTSDGSHSAILLHNFARAISACTTSGTNRFVLIDVKTYHAG